MNRFKIRNKVIGVGSKTYARDVRTFWKKTRKRAHATCVRFETKTKRFTFKTEHAILIYIKTGPLFPNVFRVFVSANNSRRRRHTAGAGAHRNAVLRFCLKNSNTVFCAALFSCFRLKQIRVFLF